MEYGNLAYKLPEQYDEPIKRENHKREKEKTVNTTAVSNKRNRTKCSIREQFSCNMRDSALAVSAGFMISKFVAVNEMNQQVASLKSQLTTLESATSQMVLILNRVLTLQKLKEATTRLGMQRPEKYQTIYVNVKQEDMTEKTAGEVEGLTRYCVCIEKIVVILYNFQHKIKWTSIIIKLMKNVHLLKY